MNKEQKINYIKQNFPNVAFDGTETHADLDKIISDNTTAPAHTPDSAPDPVALEPVKTTDDGSITRPSGIIIKKRNVSLQPGSMVMNCEPIVILPEGANKEQQRIAKVYNAFAYAKPNNWDKRQEWLLQKLEAAQESDVPVSVPELKVSQNLPVGVLPN
jgi:hypothetical protein